MKSFPFTSDGGDRKVYTKDFRMLFSKYFANGVFDGGFAVTPATGMKVNISQGWCNINGVFGYSEETVEKQIETVSSETYFNIVLRLDDNKVNRNIEIYVVKGTSSPAELTRNETVYELCIARIKVGASDQSITLAMIEDTRLNTELCGIVANAVQVLDTDTYYEQLQGKLDEVIDIVNQALDETLAGNLQNQINEIETLIKTKYDKPTVLYDGATQTNFTLSQNYNDYDIIEVIWRPHPILGQSSARMTTKNVNRLFLNDTQNVSGVITTYRCEMTFSGKNVTLNGRTQVVNGASVETVEGTIYMVIGYKLS